MLRQVLEFLYDNDIPFETKDDRFAKPTFKHSDRALVESKDMTPYPDQLAAVKSVKTNPRGIITLPTGCGKSHVIAMLLAETKLKTLVIVPTVELREQLRLSLGRSLTSTAGVTVENIDSTALKSLKDFDCLIIDEGHHVAAKTYHKLNKACWGSIRYRYFFTATPFRNQTEETLLFESIAGQLIYELTYHDAVKSGYIVPVEAYYVDLPKQTVTGESYAQVYSQLVTNNDVRNLEIAKIINKLYWADKPTLCLVKEIAHGKNLVDLTGLPFANGGDVESRKWISQFSEGEIKSLIGTYGLLGEGIDTKPCEWVLLAGMGKAKSNIMQMVGRSVRRYPGKVTAKVVLFRDASHKWMLNHFKEQRKILFEEYGVKPTKLEI